MMGSTASRDRVGVAVTMLCWAVLGGAPASGQAVTGPAGVIESDPISCWLRTDKTAVHIAEQFELTLTCGVIETSQVRVVADENGLDPTLIELIPFEVVNGTRHRDVVVPPWRYFQYSYTLRLLDDGFFGRDLNVPSIQLTYNVQTSGDGGTQGVAQVYVLPALAMHILSLVPEAANDIEDAAPETFGDTEARLFRANVELVAAGIFFAFAAVLAALGVVRSLRGQRTRVATVAPPLPAGAVLRGCAEGTAQLKSDVADAGWTPELTGRALAMMRIAGALAVGRPVAQVPVGHDAPAREGQLALRKGRFRPTRTLVSAPTTAATIARQIDGNGGPPAAPSRLALLEDVLESLRAFETARYSRDGHVDAATLDSALERGAEVVGRLQVATRWPARTAEAIAKTAAGLRGAVWSR